MNDSKSDIPPIEVGARSVTDLFHRLNSVIPLDQQVVAVRPEVLAYEALQTMEENGFSQLPVVVGREVLGIFSYRSYAKAIVKHASSTPASQKFNPLELPVDECLEPADFARVSDEFIKWFEYIDQNDAVLVGEPNRLQGIVTAMDILRYLYGVASPFVLIAETELALRALIRLGVDAATLVTCIKTCLADKYGDNPPSSLEEMTFNDYVQIIGDGRNWQHFLPIFGGDRIRTRIKLEQLRDLRNDVFHFKREITTVDYEDLAALRDWMLLKARAAEARKEEGIN